MAETRAPRGRTILVVEDSDDVRSGLTQLLEFHGFTVLDAADGARAWQRLGANPEDFALILLDLILPGDISGHDFRRRQLADAALARVPTIVLTGADVSPQDREPLHPDEWLDKPYPVQQLLALVRQYVP